MKPAELGPQADPTSDYLARPPWYFLPLFQLLKYFPGKLSLIPTVALPGALFAIIFLLPFFDRRKERRPLRRPAAMAAFSLILFGATGLIVLSKYQDGTDPGTSAKLNQQDKEAGEFLEAAFQPQEIGRSIAITPPNVAHPVMSGSPALKIFSANCANCHGAEANGGPLGPSLVNLARRRKLSADFLVTWIEGHGREASADSMPKYSQLTEEERRELAEWLLKLEAPVEQKATAPMVGVNGEPPEAFSANCAFCHGDRGEGSIGPPLIGVSSKPGRALEDLKKIMDDARAYNLEDPMPDSFPELSESDKHSIAEWLERLKAK